jgi:hypothetical protein
MRPRIRVAAAVAWILVARPAAGQSAPRDSLLDRPARLAVENVDLESALVALQRQSGVSIGFSPGFLPPGRRVSCACRDLTVRQALERLLAGTALDVRVVGSQILLAPRGADTARRTLTGQVLDRGSGAPLPNVRLSVAESVAATVTDSAGGFVLADVPVAALRLAVSRIDVAPDTVTVPPDRHVLRILASRRSVELAPLVVTAAAPPDRTRFEQSAQGSTVTFDAQQIRAIPGTLEPDVLRAVQLAPGTVARNDYSVGYNVRGGENDQNLVLLDGFTVFNPSHLGGLFSTFDPAAIASMDFLSGAFPASYGSRLSSVLDVTLRDGRREGIHGGALLSLLAGRLSFDGPLGPGSFLVSARRTYADAVVRTFTPWEVPYYFTDLIAKVAMPTGPRGRLSVTAFWGRDALDLEVVERDTLRGLDEAVNLDFAWGNRLAGLTWRQQWGPGLLTARAGLTAFDSDFRLVPDIAAMQNDVHQWSAGLRYQWPVARHRLGLGADFERYHVRYRVEEPGLETFGQDPQQYGFLPILNRTYNPVIWSAFADDEWRVTGGVIVRPGLRLAHVTGAALTTLDPRLSLKLFLTSRSAFTLSAGRYHQVLQSLHDQDLPLTIYEFWVGADRRVPVARADQVVAGFEQWLGDSWQIAVEGYRREFTDLIIPNRAIALRDEGDEFLRMTGDAWGADVWIRRHVGAVRGWLGYSYGTATRRLGAQEFPASHDRRHTLNLVIDAPGPLGADLGLRWSYGSPLPYSGIAGEWNHMRYSAGLGTFVYGDDEPVSLAINDRRFPSYHRLDLGLRWRLGGPGLEWRPYFQIANAYNRKNVFWYDYDFGPPPTRTGVSQVPFVPTFGVEVSW